MKKYLFLFLFVLIYNALHAQDLIITTNQDTIDCKILWLGNGLIYFSTIENDEEIKTSLSLNQVDSYTQDGHTRKKVSNAFQREFEYAKATESEPLSMPQSKKDNYARFRVAVVGGYSRRTIALPSGTPNVTDYYRRAFNGFNYGMELNYFFNRFLGMGINYSASHFNPTGNNPDPNFIWYSEHLSCKTRMQQIIPTFNMRALDKKKQGGFLATIGLGYAGYKTKFFRTDKNDLHAYTEKGWTLGLLLGVGYDIPISKMFAIYVHASLNGGVVTDATIINESNGSSTTYSVDDINYGVGLGRLNLSIGLRFAK